MGKNKDNSFFSNIFDLNGDGKISWEEEYLAYKMFEEIDKEASSHPYEYGPDILCNTKKYTLEDSSKNSNISSINFTKTV